MTRNEMVVLALVASTCSVGCTTGSTRTLETRAVGSTSTDNPSVITAAQLLRAGAEENLFTALSRVRPSWLGSARSVPMVVINDGPARDLSVLVTFPISEVADVRLERASGSAGRFGVAPDGRVIVGDVLVVRTHHR